MKRVGCPTHGESVLRLAQGRLGYAEAVRAEQTRQECGHCRAWWGEVLESEPTQAVVLGVQEGIRDFRPPQVVRSRKRDYMAAAAVVGLVVGSLLIVPGAGEKRQGTDNAVARDALEVPDSDLIFSEGFEGESMLTPVVGEANLYDLETGAPTNHNATLESGDTIFSDDLERGSFDGWSQHS
jgi:hypothetical protein